MEKSDLLISIIIPVYNRERLIGETLDSIQNQSYKNWECIIVDDGSKDNTINEVLKYCQTDTRFKLYKRSEQYLAGGSGARNQGYYLSQGQLIQWFDSDDLMTPNHLEQKVKCFEQDEKLEIAFCHCAHFSEDPEKILGYWKVFPENIFERVLTDQMSIQTSLPMFKKALVEQSGLFIEDILIADDWEFICRILITKPNFHCIDEALILYRMHEIQKIKTYSRHMSKCLFRSRKKVFFMVKNQDELSIPIINFFSLNLLKKTKRYLSRGYLILAIQIILFLNANIFGYYKFSLLQLLKLHTSIMLHLFIRRGFSFGTKYYINPKNILERKLPENPSFQYEISQIQK